jgi:hypothetical protein
MSCNGGRLCFKVCSASKASLVHVRAMSFKMACTRGFGAPSANFSHSAARSLHSSEFNTGIPSQRQWGQSKAGRTTVEFFGVREKTTLAAPPPGFDHGGNLVSGRSGIRRS